MKAATPRTSSAHLESDAVDEEALRGFGVRSADDDMTSLRGRIGSSRMTAGATMVLSFGTAGSVVRPDRGWIL